MYIQLEMQDGGMMEQTCIYQTLELKGLSLLEMKGQKFHAIIMYMYIHAYKIWGQKGHSAVRSKVN